MRKTSVYLTNDEAEWLRRAAAREGRSQAELIRQGVRHICEEADAQAREFRSLGKGRGGGMPYEGWSSDALYDKATGKR